MRKDYSGSPAGAWPTRRGAVKGLKGSGRAVPPPRVGGYNNPVPDVSRTNPQPTPQARTAPTAHPPPRYVRPAASYLWRLLLLIPAGAMLAVGWVKYVDVPGGGTVQSIRVTTKPGPVGQFAEAKRQVRPSNPDLYLKLHLQGIEKNTRTFKDMPVGNGLIWHLDDPIDVKAIRRVEVWDDDTFGDTLLDQVSIAGGEWSAEGGEFRIELQGVRPQPPEWALPVAAAGATLCAVVLLRFVWDQVI